MVTVGNAFMPFGTVSVFEYYALIRKSYEVILFLRNVVLKSLNYRIQETKKHADDFEKPSKAQVEKEKNK